MAMDFFEHQAHARRLTLRLVLLFSLAVVCIVATVCLVLGLTLGGVLTGGKTAGMARPLANLWLYTVVAPATLSVIGLGSLYKTIELARGGEAVALLLGGRLLQPQSGGLAEQRLLNVVEEMAIASGLPVPPVYVMKDERGINAFAAGFRPDQAVIGVTRGCLEHLNRDELQGVIAHEFSHILNGDMRLNIRLIGVLHGILVIALVGYYVLRAVGRGGSGDKKGATFAIAAAALALMGVGYVGVFFGRLIKSAISRQREFLADASAVQFTRNPDGIAGALRKIGGLQAGSRVVDEHAEEASHMFFGNGVRNPLFTWLATHPSLTERIRRIDPAWDGRFPRTAQLPPLADDEAPRRRPAAREAAVEVVPEELAAGLAVDSAAELDELRRKAKRRNVQVAEAPEKVGQPEAQEVSYAHVLVPDYPPLVRQAADEPHGARAVILAILLEDRPEIRDRQQRLLAERLDAATLRELALLLPQVDALAVDARLPLAELCVRALKQLSVRQYKEYRAVLQAVVQADDQLSRFEYLLWTIVVRTLDIRFGLEREPTVKYRRLDAVAPAAITLLDMLAAVGHDSPVEADAALRAGLTKLGLQADARVPRGCSLRDLDLALRSLAQAVPAVKRTVVEACAACTGADGRATSAEAELLRAACAVLGCPMPPLLPTAGQVQT
ncbi:MAG: M48 family metallopeptidase [Pirellulales bacterium]|nr:M48 family metallopeptidase [Pirellulales bacterium]